MTLLMRIAGRSTPSSEAVARIRYRLTTIPYCRDRLHVVRNEFYLMVRRTLTIPAFKAIEMARSFTPWQRWQLGGQCAQDRWLPVEEHPSAAAWWMIRGYPVRMMA